MNPTLNSYLRSFLCVLAAAGLTLGRAADPTSKSVAPAKVEQGVKESDLTTVVLTPLAEKRLGIEVRLVERRALKRTRLWPGEIVLPANVGVAGTAGAASDRASVFTLLPQLAPAELVRLAQGQIDAEGQVEQAGVQVEAARINLTRAEQLARDKAGSLRAVDDARLQLGLAEAGQRVAKQRRDLLGPPLLTAGPPPRLWVRVPVFSGALAELDRQTNAWVGELGSEGARWTAQPVAAPPTANAAGATVDLYYEVEAPPGRWQWGQRVGVHLPLRDPGPAAVKPWVVPWASVVRDAEGGTWVYAASGPQRFTRHRVRVDAVMGEWAAIGEGLPEGTSVVTTGVAELFGTEFGAGK
jgi:hypothetical protein